MADVTISALPATTPNSTAVIPFSQGGVTYAGALSSLAAASLVLNGTWTPLVDTEDGISSPSITYSIQQGNYIKINNFIFINGWMRGVVNNKGGSSKKMFIFGLPFDGSSTYNTVSPISIGSNTGFVNKPRALVVYGSGVTSFRPNEARIYMWRWDTFNAAIAGTEDMNVNDLPAVGSTFDLQFAGTYIGKQ